MYTTSEGGKLDSASTAWSRASDEGQVDGSRLLASNRMSSMFEKLDKERFKESANEYSESEMETAPMDSEVPNGKDLRFVCALVGGGADE